MLRRHLPSALCIARQSFTRSVVDSALLPTLTRDASDAGEIDDILDFFDGAEALREQGKNVVAGLDLVRLQKLSEHEPNLKLRRDRVNKHFEQFGSVTSTNNTPRMQLYSPSAIQDINIEALAAAQAHLGHSTALWNPLTQPFIFGVRNGIHILNLDITLSHLRRAAEVIKGVAKNDGNILFVGTRDGQKRAIIEASKRAEAYHVFDRWIPGTITNGKQVVGKGKVRNLLTKHKRNSNPPEFTSTLPNSVVPDLVVVLNPLENRILLKECAKGRVPTIGIIDSDADPRWVTYSIPANDDSIRCASLVAGVLSRSAADGRAESAIPDWEQIDI